MVRNADTADVARHVSAPVWGYMVQKKRMGTAHRVLICLLLIPAVICFPFFGAMAFAPYGGRIEPVFGLSAVATLSAVICSFVGLYLGHAKVAWAGVAASAASLIGFFAVFLADPYFGH